MRHPARPLIQVFVSGLLLPAISHAAPEKTGAGKQEQVRLAYELVLTKCRGGSCHSELLAKGKVHLLLEEEDPSFAWGYHSFEEHAGELVYQPWFKASRASRGQEFERSLSFGFVGRIRTMSGKEVTSAEELFARKKWEAFPAMSVSGSTYSEGTEVITPTLHVRILKAVK